MDGFEIRDTLTGLPNRHRFEEELGSHVARSRRSGWQGAMLAIDLDDYKEVNETLGNAVGDELVLRAADKLKARLRRSDFIARVGMAEFAVLMHDANVTSARIVADTLVTALASEDSGERPPTTASVGIALIDGPTTGEELMDRAGAALDAAKVRDASGFVLYSPTLDRGNGPDPVESNGDRPDTFSVVRSRQRSGQA
jgi:diguanylate cyclase (GGDEF)-like protein